MRGPRPRGIPKKIPAWAWAWLKWRIGGKVGPVPPKPKPSPKPAPKPKPPVPVRVHMYDDVNEHLIPKDAAAVAGYIGGRWPNYPKVVKGWPRAKHLSIAVASSYDADCLDVEPGDAPISLAPAWVKKQLKLRKQGKKYNTPRPILYTSASWGEKLIGTCSKAGLVLGQDYLWWSAHYDPRIGEHICGPKTCKYPGLKHSAHGTQWTDHALGRSLDESTVLPSFFA